MWTRVWEGTRVSLYIGFLAAFLDMFVGVTFGAISGFLGGRVDDVMQRVIEILNGIPYLVVAILAMVVFDPGIITISIAIGMTGWTLMAQDRARQDAAAKEPGVHPRLALSRGGRVPARLRSTCSRTLSGSIIMNLMFTIPAAIFAEAFLSFIGLGIQVPDASLGSLISDGAGEMRFHPYLLLFPAAGVLPADGLLQPAGRRPARRPRPEDEEVAPMAMNGENILEVKDLEDLL